MHVIDARHVIYEFSPEMEPAWRVPDGAEVEIQCVDGSGGTIHGEQDLVEAVQPDRVNDATGPILIEGARRGDVLGFSIHSIDVVAERGWTVLIPGFGLHGERVREPRTRMADVRGKTAVVLDRFQVPIRPMLGTIGVAPISGAWSTLIPHDHGGNLDTSDVRAGTRVLLPVNHDGALLAMGDAKAAMGDGEICSTGIEVPVRVRGRLDVLRGRSIARPMIETETEWMTVASAEEYLDACRLASGDMIDLLADVHGLDWEDAYILASVVSSLRVSQVVDPLLTVRCCVRKEYLRGVFDELAT